MDYLIKQQISPLKAKNKSSTL